MVQSRIEDRPGKYVITHRSKAKIPETNEIKYMAVIGLPSRSALFVSLCREQCKEE